MCILDKDWWNLASQMSLKLVTSGPYPIHFRLAHLSSKRECVIWRTSSYCQLIALADLIIQYSDYPAGLSFCNSNGFLANFKVVTSTTSTTESVLIFKTWMCGLVHFFLLVGEPRDPNKANRTKVRQIAKFGMIVNYKIVINNLI